MCAESIKMTQEVIDLLIKQQEYILEKLEKIESNVSDLTNFKNRLIGMGVGLSAVFAYLFDVLKTWFSK